MGAKNRFGYMTSVGEILKQARERKNLTIEQVEKAIRIRSKFILAIENDDLGKLPGPTYAKGFVRNYARFLGLPVEETLAFYRRLVTGEEFTTEVRSRVNIATDGKLRLTPQVFTTVAVGLLVAAFFGYLVFAYFQFSGSPVLLVTSPVNNSTVSQDEVKVMGKTDPSATLYINNERVNLDENGGFEVEIPLRAGLNTITVTAVNKHGRETKLVRNLRLEK